MRTETKVLISILIFSLVLVLGAVFLLGNKFAGNINITISDEDYLTGQKIGSDSAKIKLVEFSDFQCPACKAAEPFVLNVREKYKNDLQFFYFHFPLTQHVHSRVASNFAEYASKGNKFWEVHDKLFQTQEDWTGLESPVDFFANLGEEVGLDKEKVKEAIEKGEFNEKITQNLSLGQRLGVDSTPTFYLNNKKLILRSFTELDKLIGDELNK